MIGRKDPLTSSSSKFRSDEQEWRDNWNYYAGHSEYIIEEMFTETEERGWIKTILFDALVKNMVITEEISSDVLRALLKTWRSRVASDIIPEAL